MFDKKRKIAALMLAVMLFGIFGMFGCAEKPEEYSSRVIYAMDTVVEFYISAKDDVTYILNECENLVYEVEKAVSMTRKDSDVYLLNANGSAEVSDHTLSILNAAKRVYDATNGAFDPTVAPAVQLWKSLDGGTVLPTADELKEIKAGMGFDKIVIDGNNVSLDGCKIDLGGIAKGYAADLVIGKIYSYAEDYGITGGIISFGGAVSVFGEKKNGSDYSIGLRRPEDASKTFGSVKIKGTTHVSVSGAYERYCEIGGEKYHHILDPETLYPADNDVISVSVIAPDGMLSDALSTALFVMGYDRAVELTPQIDIAFSAVFLMKDMSVKTIGNVDFYPDENT